MTRRSARSWVCLLAAAALAGCAVGPDYHRPDTQAPESFRGAEGNGARGPDLAWWDLFQDARLRDLIRSALADGFDARIAAARVEEERAIAAEVHGELLPSVGYTASADRGRNTILGNPNPAGNGNTGNGFDGYLGAAWELDIWGRVRRLDEAARSRYLETEEARRAVCIGLVSDVATSYFELLELDRELAIAREAVTSFGDSLRLFNRQLEGGTASRLDVASAEAAQANSEARIPELERAVAMEENRLSVLLGRSPGPILRDGQLADVPVPPAVPAGLPSDLLERRPDVREAEYAAMAANADVGVTIGGFLPRIGLSAALGGVTPQLSQITSGKAALWNVGAQATGPLFQGGALRGQYEASKAAWEEAKLEYQRAALNAFGDVSDALVSRQKLAQVEVQQERTVKAYEEAVGLATERYKAGRASYFEVLQSQQLLFPSQVALAQTRRDQLISVVQLFKALGGGWDREEGPEGLRAAAR
jgi:multidrug efflux system outer membrane protein